MTLDLDPIRARLAAATPGPWEVDECSEETTVIVAGSDLTIICSELWQGWEGTQDAALIANAPTELLRKAAAYLERHASTSDGAALPTLNEKERKAHHGNH